MSTLVEFVREYRLRGGEALARPLHRVYVTWCESQGDPALNEHDLRRALLAMGATQTRTRDGVVWDDLSLEPASERKTYEDFLAAVQAARETELVEWEAHRAEYHTGERWGGTWTCPGPAWTGRNWYGDLAQRGVENSNDPDTHKCDVWRGGWRRAMDERMKAWSESDAPDTPSLWDDDPLAGLDLDAEAARLDAEMARKDAEAEQEADAEMQRRIDAQPSRHSHVRDYPDVYEWDGDQS